MLLYRRPGRGGARLAKSPDSARLQPREATGSIAMRAARSSFPSVQTHLRSENGQLIAVLYSQSKKLVGVSSVMSMA